MALDVGGLEHQERGPGVRQHAQMGHVPVVGDPVIGAVLAHGRNGDAVGKLEIGKLYRREQGTRHD
jgi:hypothetical protein